MYSLRLTCFLFSLFTLQTCAVHQYFRGTNRTEEFPVIVARGLVTETAEASVPSQKKNDHHRRWYAMTQFHKIRYLCWPGNTQTDAITKYSGTVCGDGTIQWDSMKTVATEASDVAITGPNGRCEWSRGTDAAWNARWLGTGCGASPDSIALPRSTADTPINSYWTSTGHKDPTLCHVVGKWPAADPWSTVMYEGTVCPHDRTKVIWNSMMTVDQNENVITCSDGKKAVWSRFDYEGKTGAQFDKNNLEFISNYFGSCGVAPAKFASLRTKV